MGFYKYVAFVGATCLTFDLFPFFAPLALYLKGVGALSALFGACYFLIKVEEYRYGVVMILICLVAQPFLDLGLGEFAFTIAEIFCIVIFALTGLVVARIEKEFELKHAKAIAEIESLQRKEAAIRKRMNS